MIGLVCVEIAVDNFCRIKSLRTIFDEYRAVRGMRAGFYLFFIVTQNNNKKPWAMPF